MIQLQQPTQLVERFQRFARLAVRREASVQPAALRDYVGTYKFFNRTIGLSLKGNRVEITLPDYPAKPPRLRASCTTETEFEFDRDTPARYGSSSYTMSAATISIARVWKPPAIHRRKLLW